GARALPRPGAQVLPPQHRPDPRPLARGGLDRARDLGRGGPPGLRRAGDAGGGRRVPGPRFSLSPSGPRRGGGGAMPEEYGGSGLDDFRFNQVLGEGLATASLAVNSALLLGIDVCAPYLLELTAPEQKERNVPDFCAARLICSMSTTEPQRGSDLAGIRTR